MMQLRLIRKQISDYLYYNFDKLDGEMRTGLNDVIGYIDSILKGQEEF